ncbi:transposase [Mycobacterium sp. Marseille-P9652]|uniref:transposase n=1 Tax=Mycobacterium sp. Marseille-P9652 TaxID=2654950 RepID=UPI0021030E7F|nr:transposase [Mycobacterium sp. Marseille-P9652]
MQLPETTSVEDIRESRFGVYVWAELPRLWVDGIHLKVRPEKAKLCLLVMLGVRARGRKELVAISDVCRKSSESWADLLRDCRCRGMIGRGAGCQARGAGLPESGARGIPGKEQRC